MSGKNTPTFEEFCQTCSEQLLYHTINSLGGFIWRTDHDRADGRIEESDSLSKDVNAAHEQIKFAVSQTIRFGVEKPLDEKDCGTSDYWRWFRWWDAYFRNMSNEDFSLFDTDCSAHADLNRWRPEGDWRKIKTE